MEGSRLPLRKNTAGVGVPPSVFSSRFSVAKEDFDRQMVVIAPNVEKMTNKNFRLPPWSPTAATEMKVKH